MSQLELFERDPLPPPEPSLAALAAALPSRVRFGTSSWTFPGWRGVVYRRRYPSRARFVRESLREYAAFPLFGCVGVDRSYYAPLTEAEWRGYAAQVPEGFVLCAKVWSELTTRVFAAHPRHGARAGQPNPRFFDADALAALVAAPMRAGLGPHAGPLIVEIPPAPRRTEPRAFADAVARLLEAAPAAPPLAFELREPALLSARYLDVLRAHPTASHVLNFHSRMPPLARQLAAGARLPGRPLVLRLMLPPGQRYADLQARFAPFDRLHAPQPAMRRDVLEILTGGEDQDVFVIVNNKAEGSSPLTVLALAQGLAERRAERADASSE